MLGLDILLGPVLEIGSKVIDRLWPDPVEKEKAKAELLRLAQAGELQELQIRMSAIIAEAQSADPWTSRARPSFLYVMYLLILFSIPIGALSVFSPDKALAVAAGMQAWLAAIPDGLWVTFGIGYTGYSVARSMDKRNLTTGKTTWRHASPRIATIPSPGRSCNASIKPRFPLLGNGSPRSGESLIIPCGPPGGIAR